VGRYWFYSSLVYHLPQDISSKKIFQKIYIGFPRPFCFIRPTHHWASHRPGLARETLGAHLQLGCLVVPQSISHHRRLVVLSSPLRQRPAPSAPRRQAPSPPPVHYVRGCVSGVPSPEDVGHLEAIRPLLCPSSSSSSQLDRVDWRSVRTCRLFPFPGKAHHLASMDYRLNPVAWGSHLCCERSNPRLSFASRVD
jgi:hypothetical protein